VAKVGQYMRAAEDDPNIRVLVLIGRVFLFRVQSRILRVGWRSQ
jgi:hypothetical protein